MKSLALIVDLDDFFGHARLTLTVSGRATVSFSLADPDSANQLRRELCRLVDEHGFDHESTADHPR